MYDPKQVHNKAGAGGGSPISHPAPAICPRCGNVNAVAVPDTGNGPSRYVVRCSGCGTFRWADVTVNPFERS